MVARVGRVTAVVVVLSTVIAFGPSFSQVVAQSSDDAAQQAAEEISAARERANQAAEDFFAAESIQDLLKAQQDRLRLELEDLRQEVADLKDAVELVAINRFVASGATGIPILTDLRKPTEQLHADVLANVVTESGATSIDDYEAARERLHRKRLEYQANQLELERSKENLLQLQATAEAEVERLREIESTRLNNEAVAAALAAQQREDARLLIEIERRQAETAREQAGRSNVVVAAATATSSIGNTTGNQGASGGETGGRTGGGGAGSNPRAAGAGYVDPIICPVVGGSAYGDTWGAPRSGGRRHEGTDMLAPTGTPLVAVVSGFTSQGNNRLGGITVSVHGDNGNRYYYAHVSSYEGVPGRVEQGQVIAYVGESGNAAGTPHLHFEIHPQGGLAMNPYPSIVAAGC